MRPTSWIARLCLKLAKCGIYKSSSFTTVSYQGMTSVLPTEPKMFAGFSPCGKSAFSIPLSTNHYPLLLPTRLIPQKRQLVGGVVD